MAFSLWDARHCPPPTPTHVVGRFADLGGRSTVARIRYEWGYENGGVGLSERHLASKKMVEGGLESGEAEVETGGGEASGEDSGGGE